MSDPARRRMTVDEVLLREDGTGARCELIGDGPVAVAPPSDRHGIDAADAAGLVRARPRPPCRSRVEAGIRVSDRSDTWLQADLAAACGPAAAGPGVSEPLVVVEVLSPSTERDDRSVRLPLYREVPSIAEILPVSASRRRAGLRHRTADGWRVEDVVGDGPLRSDSVDVAVPLGALYDGVD